MRRGGAGPHGPRKMGSAAARIPAVAKWSGHQSFPCSGEPTTGRVAPVIPSLQNPGHGAGDVGPGRRENVSSLRPALAWGSVPELPSVGVAPAGPAFAPSPVGSMAGPAGGVERLPATMASAIYVDERPGGQMPEIARPSAGGSCAPIARPPDWPGVDAERRMATGPGSD